MHLVLAIFSLKVTSAMKYTNEMLVSKFNLLNDFRLFSLNI
jgi:hypothetical protein